MDTPLTPLERLDLLTAIDSEIMTLNRLAKQSSPETAQAFVARAMRLGCLASRIEREGRSYAQPIATFDDTVWKLLFSDDPR